MKFNTLYNHSTIEGKKFLQPSLTIQSAKDECDINLILNKYAKTGVLPDMIKSNPQYGDFSNVSDYQTAMSVVMHAESQFNSLSAKIRARFDNDPATFLEFATNPANASEMVTLGLATKKAVEAVKTDSTVNQAGSVIQPEPAVGEGPKA